MQLLLPAMLLVFGVSGQSLATPHAVDTNTTTVLQSQSFARFSMSHYPIDEPALSPRQDYYYCQSGYVECVDGCIPYSFTCCSDGGGCGSKYYCDIGGCCPRGEVCSGSSGQCQDGTKRCGFDCILNSDTCSTGNVVTTRTIYPGYGSTSTTQSTTIDNMPTTQTLYNTLHTITFTTDDYISYGQPTTTRSTRTRSTTTSTSDPAFATASDAVNTNNLGSGQVRPSASSAFVFLMFAALVHCLSSLL